ncbi:MAG: CocE/NonD family hydrolase [Pseudomonadota bacterium]
MTGICNRVCAIGGVMSIVVFAYSCGVERDSAPVLEAAQTTQSTAAPRDGAPYPMPDAKYQVRIENNVMIEMRDGVRLATDLYVPEGLTDPAPVLMTRTPYGKSGSISRRASFFAGQGYVVAVQDVRGKFESEGIYHVSAGSRSDGYDTITWLAAQDWSNGKIGTFGCSYLGENQYMLMAEKHPNHFAAIPEAAGGGIGSAGGLYSYFGEAAGSGVMSLASAIGWFWDSGVKTPGARTGSDIEIDDWNDVYAHLPFIDVYAAFNGPDTDFEAYARDLPAGKTWMKNHDFVRDEDTVATPALHVNSWYDYGVEATAFARGFFEQQAVNDVAKNQYMIISPAGHCGSADLPDGALVGDLPVGDPRYDYYKTYVDWFDYWLKGVDNDILSELPKVSRYVLGANEWRASSQWPPAPSSRRSYYLTADLANEDSNIDGALSLNPPNAPGSTTYTYDPMNPSYTKGGADCCWAGVTTPIFGSYDQREAHARDDVLFFQTPLLEERIEIAGAVEVELFVSSDAPDTDFMVRLLTVDPDGRAFNLTEKMFRARYRESMESEVFMESGGVYQLSFRLPDTAVEFPKGHRIGVSVTSSDFPRYVRNLNTMGSVVEAVTPRVAENTVHHSADYPSRIILPVQRTED